MRFKPANQPTRAAESAGPRRAADSPVAGHRPGLHPSARRACAGFTLAEVLAALVFMAIVIPVAVEGLRVASRAAVVGQRKAVAVRIAESTLNELMVTGQGQMAAQRGVTQQGALEYRWLARLEAWNQNLNAVQLATMQLMTVEVTFPAQGKDYSVRLSTLVGMTR